LAQTAHVLAIAESRGWIQRTADDDRQSLINDATMGAVGRFDELMRTRAFHAIADFEASLERRLTETVVTRTVELLRSQRRLLREVAQNEAAAVAEGLVPEFGPPLVHSADRTLVAKLATRIVERLGELGAVEASPDLLALRRSASAEALAAIKELLDRPRETFDTRLLAAIEADRAAAWD